jgi:hypothetical protein
MRLPGHFRPVGRMQYAHLLLELLKPPYSGASRRRLYAAILAIPTYCSGLRLALHPD